VKDPDGSDEYAPCERYDARDWVLFRPPPVRIVFQRQSAATTDVCPCMAPGPYRLAARGSPIPSTLWPFFVFYVL